ncbi:MAG: hypothetical protein WDA28_13030 [Castellaniella sp.]
MDFILIEITAGGYEEIYDRGSAVVGDKMNLCGVDEDDISLVEIDLDGHQAIYARVTYTPCVADAIEAGKVNYITQDTYEEILSLYGDDVVKAVNIEDRPKMCSIM